MALKNRNYLTPHDVAEMLMVSPITVRQLAQKGDLIAQTTPGGHRRFMSHDVERFAKERGLSLQLPDNNDLRVLIVDDDKQLSGYLGELLNSFPLNIVVDTADDGFSAGRIVQKFLPNIILLDLMMPGLDGFQVCKRLKADPTTKAIRVIAMTGYPTQENINRIIARGAEACLYKPIDKDALLSLLGINETKNLI